jgi:uncharacterized protein YndB with AHSA1/START domain
MRQIIHAVYMDAAPSAVYDALTTRAGLMGWWTRKVTVEEGEGGVIRFTLRATSTRT